MTFTEAIQHILQDKLLLMATPVFLLLLILEYWIDKRKQYGLYHKKDMYASLAMGIFSLIVEFIPKVIFFMLFYYIHEANLLGLRDIVGRQWWSWLILLFLDDLAYYWFHRSNHEVRLFWAGHVPHHSSVKYNFGTAIRQGVGERLHKYIFYLFIPLFGFDPVMMFILMSTNLIYQYWIHTELIDKFPKFIEFIFNTPSHHRVHHASQARYLDRNHAGIFIIWDRLFGTFSEEKENEKPVYGLTSNLENDTWSHIATHEYTSIWKDVGRANKWSDKLKYIFYPPGWSHDGPDLTAKKLRSSVKN